MVRNVLVPLLSLVYVNDDRKLSLKGFLPLLADDSGFFYSNQAVRINVAEIKVDLQLIKTFSDLNGLSLNSNKTVVMYFRTRDSNPVLIEGIYFEGVEIKEVETFKYLGRFIDNQLSCKHHIYFISRKLSSCASVLCIKKFLPKSVLKRIYFAHGYLSCLPALWGNDNKNYTQPLEVLQKRCLKHMYKLPQRYPTADLFNVHC